MSILNFETAVGLQILTGQSGCCSGEVDPNTKLETESALLHLTCSLVYKRNVSVLM